MNSLSFALDTAAYVLMVTFVLGLVFAAMLIRTLFFDKGFKVPRPVTKTLPTLALDALKEHLTRCQEAVATAQGQLKTDLLKESIRVRKRLDWQDGRTKSAQEEYYLAARRRDKGWAQWKELHGRALGMGRALRGDAMHRVRELGKQYQGLERAVAQEWHGAEARDRADLEALKSRGLLSFKGLAPPLAEPPEAEGTKSVVILKPAPAGPPHPHPNEKTVLNTGLEDSLGLSPPPPAKVPEASNAVPRPPLPEPSHSPAGTRSTEILPQDGSVPAPAGVPPFKSVVKEMGQTDMMNPDAEKSHLRYADPQWNPGTPLNRENLSGSDFSRVRFMGRHLYRHCDFSDAIFRHIVLGRQDKPHRFEYCDLRRVDFSNSRLAYVVFEHCDLGGTRWTGARLERVKFTHCQFEGVAWEGADLKRALVLPLEPENMLFEGAGNPPYNVTKALAAKAD